MNTMYVDVLKEIGNIGAGNATTAIATMIKMRNGIMWNACTGCAAD